MTIKHECSKWLHTLFGMFLALVAGVVSAQSDDEPAKKAIQMSDILVFENGVWKNEKTGETIPAGTLVQGTGGTLRLDREGEEGIVALVSGDGVRGRGKYIKITNGGNKIDVRSLPFSLTSKLNHIRIHTMDESGKPLGKVDIRVLMSNFKDENRPKTTDENGTMILQLPDSPKELYISASVPGRVSQLVYWEREDMNSNVKIPEAVTFTLRKGNTIGGDVVDQDDKPIKGAVFHILSRPNGFGMPGHLKPADSHILTWGDGKPNTFGGVTSCKTDENGRWTLDSVPDGKFYPVEIEIFHPDYVMNDELGGSSVNSQNETLIEKLRKGEYRFVMKRGFSVSGTVYNAEGKPLKDALIVPGGDQWYYHQDREKSVRTDADGKYRIDSLRFGSGTLTVIAEGLAPDMKRVDFEKDMKPVDFELKSGKTICFRFTDENGKPIPKVQVSIGGSPDSWWRDGANIFNSARSGGNQFTKIPVYANDEGFYSWNWAPEDRLRFSFHKEGFLMEWSSRENWWFVARPEPYEIVLHHQNTFRGTVVDAETNQPIQEYSITYGTQTNNQSDIDNYTWQTPQEQTFTATETFQFVPLFRYDTYWLRFTAKGYDPFIAGPYPLHEETPILKITLKQATPGAMLSGQVFLPNGNPAALAKTFLAREREYVQITPPNFIQSTRRPPSPIVETDEQGKFQLELPTDDKDYRLYVVHSEGFIQVDKADIKEGLTLPLQAYGKLDIKIPYDTKPNAYNRFSLSLIEDTVILSDQNGSPIPPERKMFVMVFYPGSISPEGTVVIDSIVPGKYHFLKMARESDTVYNVTNFFTYIRPAETKQWDLTAPNGVTLTARIRLPDDYEGEFTAEDWSVSKFNLSADFNEQGQSIMNYHGKIRPSQDNPREGTVEIEHVVHGPCRYDVMLHKATKRDMKSPSLPPMPEMLVGVTVQQISIPKSTGSEMTVFDLGTIEISRYK